MRRNSIKSSTLLINVLSAKPSDSSRPARCFWMGSLAALDPSLFPSVPGGDEGGKGCAGAGADNPANIHQIATRAPRMPHFLPVMDSPLLDEANCACRWSMV